VTQKGKKAIPLRLTSRMAYNRLSGLSDPAYIHFPRLPSSLGPGPPIDFQAATPLIYTSPPWSNQINQAIRFCR